MAEPPVMVERTEIEKNAEMVTHTTVTHTHTLKKGGKESKRLEKI